MGTQYQPYRPLHSSASKHYQVPDLDVPVLYLPIFDAADRPDAIFVQTQHGPSNLANWLLRESAEAVYREKGYNHSVDHLRDGGSLAISAQVFSARFAEPDTEPTYNDTPNIQAGLKVTPNTVEITASRGPNLDYAITFGATALMGGVLWEPRSVTGHTANNAETVTKPASGLLPYQDITPYLGVAYRSGVLGWTAHMLGDIERGITFNMGDPEATPRIVVETQQTYSF